MTIRKYEHAYLKYNEVEYKDFDLYIGMDIGECKNTLFMSWDYKYQISNSKLNLDLMAVKVQPGSPVYIGTKLPTPIDIIRKKYQVKLKPEAADCIVMAGIPDNPAGNSFSEVFILPDTRQIVGGRWGNPAKDILQAVLDINAQNGLATKNNVINASGQIFYRVSDDKGVYRKYLDGTLEKPAIYYKNLDLDGQDELTMDTIKMTMSIGCQEYTDKDQTDTMDMNLKSIYNYNWRQYKGTIGLMMRLMKNVKNYSESVFSHFVHYRALWSKPAKEMIDECMGSIYYAWGKDRDMARTLLREQLNMKEGSMIVSLPDVNRKLMQIRMTTDEFANLFDVKVRIE